MAHFKASKRGSDNFTYFKRRLGDICAVAALAIGASAPTSAVAQTQEFWEVLLRDANDAKQFASSPYRACEISWRDFNGDGPLGPTEFTDPSGGGLSCWRPATADGQGLDDSYGGFGTGASAQLECPAHLEPQGILCVPTAQFAPTGQCTPKVDDAAKPQSGDGDPPNLQRGQPILIATGDKVQRITDYVIPGPRPFRISRTYRSSMASERKYGLGHGWSFDHESFIWFIPGTNDLYISVEDGAVAHLTRPTTSGSIYTSDKHFDARLERFDYPERYWVLTHGDGRVIRYDALSRKQKETWPDGYERIYDYEGDSPRIQSITDSLGRVLSFAYVEDRVASINTSDGVTLAYEYDYENANNVDLIGSERLIKFTKTTHTGAVREQVYHYEKPDLRWALTGITDELGQRYATWDYDEFYRGVSSELAGGAERVTIAYDDVNNTRTVTNALGKQTVYEFEKLNGRLRLKSVDGIASSNCAASDTDYVNNSFGDRIQMVDREGTTNSYEYNARNLETRRTLAVGAAEERVIETEWHPTLTRRTKMTTPELETVYEYGPTGLLTAMEQTDQTTHTAPYSTNGAKRRWEYAYSPADPAPVVSPEGDVSIVNSTMESAVFTGWVGTSGNVFRESYSHGGVPAYPGIGRRGLAGSNGNPVSFEAEQTVDLPTLLFDAIDADAAEVRLAWLQYALFGSSGAGGLAFLDDNGDQIGSTLWSSGYSEAAWAEREEIAPLPVGARKVKILFRCDYLAGPGCRVFFDNVSLAYGPPDGPPPFAKPALLTSIDGPLPGPSDTVQYEYDAQANLIAVINELGHRTDILSLNDVGQPLEIRDANNVITQFTYDDERRVASIKTAVGHHTSGTTTFTYDAIGQITKIDTAAKPEYTFTYDTARRLTRITNRLGETRNFSYDALSNVTKVEDKDRFGAVTASQDFVFDELGRLLKAIGAAGQETKFGYDRDDRLASVEDPRGNLYANGFDALDRLVSQTDPDGGVTATAVRSDGAPSAVTDAESVTTAYTRNGWGEVIREISPNRGTMDYVYDERGLVTQITDGRGVVTQYTYDAAGRLTGESFPSSPSENITYRYDEGSANRFTVGRLSSTSDGSNAISFNYDRRGNIDRETLTIEGPSGGQSYQVRYTYGKDDMLLRITYPSGRIVDYGPASHGEISQVRMREGNGAPFQSLMASTKHMPMSGSGLAHMDSDYGLWSVTSSVLGNGLTLTADHDTDGRLSGLRVAPSSGGAAVQDLAFTYDLNSNITAMTDGVDPARSQTFQYDPLDRLTRATGLYGTIDYTYDLVGNRTALTRTGGVGAAGLQNASYSYQFGSHKLNAVTGGSARSFTYLPSGQASSDTKAGVTTTYTYDAAGRMEQSSENGTLLASYAYDPFEQRVSKATPSGMVHYVHDQYGKLIAEHDGVTGEPLREYIYLGLIPVVMVDHSSGTPTPYWIHTDQVLQPQKMTDANGSVVWDRVATPFGVEVQTTGALTNPLKFPGQIEDLETALSQNWHRDYDAELGRYVQSDPIGLMGGVNTYAYVGGNPLVGVDPTGQFLFLAPAAPAAVTATVNLVGAVIVLATAQQFRNTPEPGGPPSSNNDDDCSDDDCDKEWQEAYIMCAERRGHPRYRKIAPWNMPLNQCARGLVSQRCGGNAVEFGKFNG